MLFRSQFMPHHTLFDFSRIDHQFVVNSVAKWESLLEFLVLEKYARCPARNDSLLTAWFSTDLVEHVLASQCFGNTLRRVLGEWVFRIGTRDLKDSVIQHYHPE